MPVAPAPMLRPASADSCPRCQKPIVDPQGLGWCKACGYCRSLEEGQKTSAPAEPKAVPRVSARSALGQTPSWFWGVSLGILVIAAATFAGGWFLTLKPLERALLTTGQIVFGLALMFIGQFIGLVKIAPEEASLRFMDALVPLRLYGFVFKRLPATRHTLYLGAWGLAAIVSANLFIGGLGHWFTYIPKSPANQAQKVKSGR